VADTTAAVFEVAVPGVTDSTAADFEVTYY
jgi:hypothetical protein